MEPVSEYFKYLSFFVWFGLFFVLTWHWCRGLLDTRSMLQFIGIILAVAVGYELFQIVFQSTSKNAAAGEIQCISENEIYLNCGGWPIFKQHPTGFMLASMAQNIVSSLNYLYGFCAGYAQIIAGIVLYSKFSRGIWSSDVRQIIFAFGGGAVIYVSLCQAGAIEKNFMELTAWLFGFREHHGDNPNSIADVIKNLNDWTDAIEGLKAVNKDQSVFSVDYFISGLSLLSIYTMYFIVNIPLVWFSFLNIIMMCMQQFLLLSLPVDAIKMSMSFNIDPFLIIKKLFSMAMLSMALVTEFHILNWIPTVPSSMLVSFTGISLAAYLGFFWSALIILGGLIISGVFSTIAIFKAFSVGRESMDKMT